MYRDNNTTVSPKPKFLSTYKWISTVQEQVLINKDSPFAPTRFIYPSFEMVGRPLDGDNISGTPSRTEPPDSILCTRTNLSFLLFPEFFSLISTQWRVLLDHKTAREGPPPETPRGLLQQGSFTFL
ncbi:hypothetical protein CDAR_168841 [Caerostris darwini]|uniref:Uncharacterized protein n=1 Tax=Caerostris darwini TaxID=1538125 RepID=A0AAV4WRI5_9ARAC|nr:hypothetical protein CDAR_168841 [Caerostris darwini]